MPNNQTNDWIINLRSLFPSDADSISSYSISVTINGTGAENVYMNTKKLSERYSWEASDSILCIHVSKNQISPITITISCTTNTNLQSSFSVTYKRNKIETGYSEGKSIEKMVNGDETKCLIKTNPRLTGNIKIVVDENGNLYSDTFKVTDSLSTNSMSKTFVNPDIYHGEHLKMKFSGLSSEDIYAIPKECYKIFSTAETYSNQYTDIYNYGVRLNRDRMYSENFSFLAPIRIGRIIPDFMLIFRVKHSEIPQTLSDVEKMSYFIENGKLVKSFDMRENSNIGKYVRKIMNKRSGIHGDAFIAFDQDGMNSFNGISIDRGCICRYSESVYNENGIESQTELDNYITDGFKRNRIVSSNILNIEFMFNDDSDQFSINNYFGLYVRLNSSNGKFSCIGYDNNSEKYIYDKEINDFDDDSESYIKKIIYGFSTDSEFKRITTQLSKSELNESVMLKPDRNLFSGTITESSGVEESYISFSLNGIPNISSHYRIIDIRKKIIYDIIFCNNEVSSEDIYNRIFTDRTGITYDIRTTYCNLSDSIESVSKTLYSALKRLAKEEYEISIDEEFTISIFGKSESIFEIIYESDPSDISGSVSIFGYDERTDIQLDLTEDTWKDEGFAYLYPIGYEYNGNRIANAYMFNHVENDNHYTLIDSSDAEYGMQSSETIIYNNESSSEILENSFFQTLSNANGSIVNVAKKILKISKKKFIIANGEYNTNGTRTAFYTIKKIESGVCSIFPICAIDTDICDANSIISYRSGETVIGERGEMYESYYDGTPTAIDMSESENNIMDSVYGRGWDGGYISTHNNLNTFLTRLINENKTVSASPLTFPSICKWKSIGTDSKCIPYRILYSKKHSLSDGTICFINDGERLVYIGSEDSNIGFVSYINKFDEPEEALNKYVKYSEFSEINGASWFDSFSNGNASIDDIVNDRKSYRKIFSECYEGNGNCIEFISSGIKLRICSANERILKLEKYDGYSCVFVAFPEKCEFHTNPTGVIIDEIKKQILVAWHVGINSLKIGYTENGNSHAVMCRTKIGDVRIRYYKEENEIFKVAEIRNDSGYDYSSIQPSDITYVSIYSIKDNNTEYTKSNSIQINGRIIRELSNENIISILISSVYVNGSSIQESDISNRIISENFDDMNDYVSMVVWSTSVNSSIEQRNGLFDFINDSKNPYLIVRTLTGIKDLTNVSGLVSINVIDPIRYRRYAVNETGVYETAYGYMTMPTFVNPDMYDILKFKYITPESISRKMGINLDGCNILISGLNPIRQEWISKYTEETEYCNTDTLKRVGFDIILQKSPIEDSWNRTRYRRYYWNSGNMEDYVHKKGIEIGIEDNTYIGSKAMQLFGNENEAVSITEWINTEIDQNDMEIRLNVSDSMEWKIFSSRSFQESFSHESGVTDTCKRKYIRNVILSSIQTADGSILKLYRKREYSNSINFVNFTENENFEEISNFSISYIIENGDLIILLTLNEMGTYSALFKTDTIR